MIFLFFHLKIFYKMNTYFKNIIFKGFALSLLIMAGCRPATEITATWTNPEIQDPIYNNVLVVSMTDRISIKQTVESALANELRDQGVNASTSMEEFPPRFQEGPIKDKNTLMDIVRENRHDAILTVAVVDEETETRYVPGTGAWGPTWAPMGPFGYYGNFWGYYNYWNPFMYQPGYYEEDKIYFIETNLYDATTESLVWSAQSETMSPGDLATFSQQFADVIVDELTDRNFFRTETPTAQRE